VFPVVNLLENVDRIFSLETRMFHVKHVTQSTALSQSPAGHCQQYKVVPRDTSNLRPESESTGLRFYQSTADIRSGTASRNVGVSRETLYAEHHSAFVGSRSSVSKKKNVDCALGTRVLSCDAIACQSEDSRTGVAAGKQIFHMLDAR
jgi:hypothetical protein